MLAAADVHVALRLGQLAQEEDENTLLATALAVRAPRLGSVCVDLATIGCHRSHRPRRAGRPAGAAVAGTRGVGRRPRLESAGRRSARTAARIDRSASSARRSTSTATGGTSAPSPPTSSPATSPRATSTTPCSPTGWHGCSTETSPTSSVSPRRRACCAASPSSAAAPARARRRRSRASSSSSTSRPRPPARRRRSSPSPHRPGRRPRGWRKPCTRKRRRSS